MPLCSELRKRMLEKITLLFVHDVRSALTSGGDYATQKRMSLQVTLVFFEIFEKLGDKLSAYLSVPKEDHHSFRDMEALVESAGICPNHMDKFASAISFSSLSELFMLEQMVQPISAIEHESDIQDGHLDGLEGVLYPKVCGQLEEAICADDSHEFVNLTNKSVVFSASEVLRSICCHNSVECATTLLEGKTKTDLRIEVNAALEDGMYPLHLAAIKLSPSLTELFLCYGAQTNVQCNNTSSRYHGIFPLELALEALCRHSCVGDWTPTKSIYKLIYILCLPDLMGPLKTIELLSTNIAVVQKTGYRCVQEGKLVELSALLMVSWDKLMLPASDIKSSFIGKHILRQLHMLLNEESKLVCISGTDGLQQVRRKKGGLLFALSMLELFNTAGTAIQDYRLSAKVKGDVANFEVPLDVSNLLKGLGFCLKSDDIDVNDTKCLLLEVESKRSNVSIANGKDGVDTAKPYIIPQQSNNCETYDNEVVKGYGISFRMHHGDLPLPAFQYFHARQCRRATVPPPANRLVYLAIQSCTAKALPSPGNRLICLATQPSSILRHAATPGTWSFLASSARIFVRFM